MKSSFVDLQVNGFIGTDFSSASLTPEGIRKASVELGRLSTGAFLATVITSPKEVYAHSLPMLADAIECKSAPGAKILGVHLEGPFISPEDGAVGAHPKSCVLEPDSDAFDRLNELARGHVRIVTVAPERKGAPKLIKHIVKSGAAVSVGHCLASDDDVKAAVDAGATLSTHLGNGIPNMINRHRNPVFAQMSSPLTQMLISDGHHLPVSLLKIMLKLKGTGSTIITSDSAPVAGMPVGEYDIFGTRVRICEDGAIRNLNAPTLAGSSSCMADCMRFLASNIEGLTEAELWKMGRDNPLAAIGMSSFAGSLQQTFEF